MLFLKENPEFGVGCDKAYGCEGLSESVPRLADLVLPRTLLLFCMLDDGALLAVSDQLLVAE